MLLEYKHRALSFLRLSLYLLSLFDNQLFNGTAFRSADSLFRSVQAILGLSSFSHVRILSTGYLV